MIDEEHGVWLLSGLIGLWIPALTTLDSFSEELFLTLISTGGCVVLLILGFVIAKLKFSFRGWRIAFLISVIISYLITFIEHRDLVYESIPVYIVFIFNMGLQISVLLSFFTAITLRIKRKTNQRVDPTVKTPIESGKAQGTAGHP